MSAGEPTRVIVVAFTNVSTTPAPTAAPSTGEPKLPAETTIVTVNWLSSGSAKVTDERSKFEAISSITVISVGTPVAVGASLTGVIVILKV